MGVIYKGYIGIMEQKIETTTVCPQPLTAGWTVVSLSQHKCTALCAGPHTVERIVHAEIHS